MYICAHFLLDVRLTLAIVYLCTCFSTLTLAPLNVISLLAAQQFGSTAETGDMRLTLLHLSKPKCPHSLNKLTFGIHNSYLDEEEVDAEGGKPLASLTYLYLESISEVPIRLLCSPKIFFSTFFTFMNPSGRNSFKLRRKIQISFLFVTHSSFSAFSPD